MYENVIKTKHENETGEFWQAVKKSEVCENNSTNGNWNRCDGDGDGNS